MVLEEVVGSEGSVPIRKALPPTEAPDAGKRAVEVTDLLDRLAGMLLIACPCGVKIKVPPELHRATVPCTRCGREHPVPPAAAEA